MFTVFLITHFQTCEYSDLHAINTKLSLVFLCLHHICYQAIRWSKSDSQSSKHGHLISCVVIYIMFKSSFCFNSIFYQISSGLETSLWQKMHLTSVISKNIHAFKLMANAAWYSLVKVPVRICINHMGNCLNKSFVRQTSWVQYFHTSHGKSTFLTFFMQFFFSFRHFINTGGHS